MKKILAPGLVLLSLATRVHAAVSPAERALTLNIQGLDAPTQTVDTPPADVTAYGDNAVQHCYVFSSFVAFETDTDQVGAESIVLRLRDSEEPIASLCKMPRREKDRFINDVQGYALGARGPFLFVTASDSFGSAGAVSIYDVATGKKQFDVSRASAKPLRVTYEEGVLALHFFLPLNLACDLTQETCWPETLKKNHVPADTVLVRPECEHHPGKPEVLLATPVHVDDVAHAKLVFENGQPTCESKATPL